MSQSEILHFNPPPMPSDSGNNPDGALSARQKIANLPDAYAADAMPSKEELAGMVRPVSPAAQELPLSANFPAVSDFVLRSSPAGTKRSNPLRLPSRIKPLLTGLITFALLFAIFKSPILLSQLGYAAQKPAPTKVNPAVATVSPDPTISIPKINVSAPVIYAKNNAEAAIQTDLQSGVVHYAGTALPGEAGNNVIFGHSSNDWWEPGNFKFVFVLLDKLVVGDTLTMNYQSQQYLYQVTSTEVVEPTNVGVLAATADPTLTLITCTPPGTSWKRLVIHAKQISPSTGRKPQTAATTAPKAPAGTLPSNSPDIFSKIGTFLKDIGGSLSGNHPLSPTAPTTIPAIK